MTKPQALPTLDGLFQRSLEQHPDALALIDPPNKAKITGTTPLRLTYREADTAIDAIAAHFSDARLPVGSVIAVQLPNTAEFILTMLAAARVGLAVAVIPQLWRQADLSVALNRVGARAIVTCGTIDGVDHAELAMNAAVEAFSVRHVCGFGEQLPDGMISLDDIIANPPVTAPRSFSDAQQPIAITFDLTSHGLRTVPRTHVQMIAGGLSIFLESKVPAGATVAAAVAPSSFATLAASLVTWLLTGGALALHHPFSASVLERQITFERCDALIVPAPLAFRLAESRMLERAPHVGHVIGLWRAPEQASSAPDWTVPTATLTDVHLFGEVGLVSSQRGGDGAHCPLAPQAADDAANGEAFLTPQGTLAMRGAMVPVAAYATDPEQDHVDTGYGAKKHPDTGGLVITSPPAGLLGVGGYRFRTQDIQDWARRLPPGTTLAALPDQLQGHRLAGRATDSARTRDALLGLGVNALIVDAFRDRTNAGPEK